MSDGFRKEANRRIYCVEAIRRVLRSVHLYLCNCITEIQGTGDGGKVLNLAPWSFLMIFERIVVQTVMNQSKNFQS